jgi:hypothetical protein
VSLRAAIMSEAAIIDAGDLELAGAGHEKVPLQHL